MIVKPEVRAWLAQGVIEEERFDWTELNKILKNHPVLSEMNPRRRLLLGVPDGISIEKFRQRVLVSGRRYWKGRRFRTKVNKDRKGLECWVEEKND